jgi:hypothetical protein
MQEGGEGRTCAVVVVVFLLEEPCRLRRRREGEGRGKQRRATGPGERRREEEVGHLLSFRKENTTDYRRLGEKIGMADGYNL